MNVYVSTELLCRPALATAEVQTLRLLHEVRAPQAPAAAVRGVTAVSPCDIRQIDSTELLAGTACIAIRHGGERYWLRATRQGKLLLTK